jgi:hypothetical protein
MNFELVYPMVAMVALTFFMLVAMFRSRVGAVKAGEADAGFYKTYQEGKEPRATAAYSRQVVNLFESPTLFYAACMTAMITGQTSTAMLVLAWAYFALRVLHAYIHTGSNKLSPRIRVYFASWLVLLAMWASIAFGVATGG